MLVLIPVNLSDCFAAYSRYACSLRLLDSLLGRYDYRGFVSTEITKESGLAPICSCYYCNTASKPTLESCGYANPTRYVNFYFEENA